MSTRDDDLPDETQQGIVDRSPDSRKSVSADARSDVLDPALTLALDGAALPSIDLDVDTPTPS